MSEIKSYPFDKASIHETENNRVIILLSTPNVEVYEETIRLLRQRSNYTFVVILRGRLRNKDMSIISFEVEEED